MTNVAKNLLDLQTDGDYFLVGAAINLYSEALRRRAGRVLYGPRDVENLLGMAIMLISVSDPGEIEPAKREHDLTDEERDAISDPALQKPMALDEVRSQRRRG